MHPSDTPLALDYASLDDSALARCVQAGDREAFRQIMRRCNQRLFRVARSVMREDVEAEDLVQAAYVNAYERIASFRGDASLATWLTRVVLNETHGRLRQRRPTMDIETMDKALHDDSRVIPFPGRNGGEDPVIAAALAEVRRLLERAIDALPEPFRLVYVMREIEECTVEETAASLGLRAETVKTRLHRARRLLRAALHDTLSATVAGTFPFLGARCAALTDTVMQRLR